MTDKLNVEEWQITSRSEWLRRRLLDVTASEIGGLAGVDEYRTPLRIWAEKTGLATGPDDNLAMRRGRWLEPAVAKAIAETYPEWSIQPASVYLHVPELRLGATPDYFGTRPESSGLGNIQCKVIARPVFEREWEGGHAPLKYQLQSLTEAMLLGASWNCVAALVIDTFSAELVVDEVPRHAGAEARIRELVAQFWKMLDEGRQPPPNFKLDSDLIKVLHPKGGQEPPVDLSGNNRFPALAEERLGLIAARRILIEKLDAIDTEICAALGDHDAGEHPDYNVSWKLQHRAEYVSPAASYRVLRVSRKKERS